MWAGSARHKRPDPIPSFQQKACRTQAAHRSEFERFRLTTELTELQQSMNAELPGLDMQGVLKERHVLQAQLDEAAPTVALTRRAPAGRRLHWL